MNAAGARGRRLDLLTIAIPALLAGLLAVRQLPTRSLWLDEAATVAIASQHGAALWHAIARDGGNMLGYYLVMHVLIGAFGDGTAAIRAPSVIATAATAGLVSLLALRAFDRRLAISAGILCAVSLPLIFWGQNARGYALMVAFATASFVAFTAIVTAPVAEQRTSRAALAIYALTTALSIYMGLIAVLIVAAQLTLLPFAPRRARSLLVAIGAVGVICLPLVVLALFRGSSQLFWVPRPDQHVLGQAARTLTSAGLPPNFHRTGTGTLTLIITGALLLMAIGAIALAGRGRMPYGERIVELLIVAWFIVPLVLALVAAKAGLEVELARDGMLLVPPVALLLAWILHHPRVPEELGWAGVAVLVVLRALQLGPSYGVSPEPWNTAADYVRSAASADQCVAFYPQDGRMPFDYYLSRGRAQGARRLIPVLPTRAWSSVNPYVERYATPAQQQLEALARSCRVLWVIASHEGLRRGPPQSLADYRRYRALLAALDRLYPHERARKLGWAAAIHVIRFERN
jgi:uncharacterized membrane protein